MMSGKETTQEAHPQ